MIYRNTITYEQYLNMHDATANAILNRILVSLNKNIYDIAALFKISFSEAQNFILQKKFTFHDSVLLTEFLKINIPDFFIVIQKNHDLYLEKLQSNNRQNPNLQKIRKSTFWDTDFNQLDWVNGYKFIIRRIYEYGNNMEKEEIQRFYGLNTINKVLSEDINIQNNNRWKR